MDLIPSAETPWVVFQLKNELYVVEARFTQEMLVAPKVTSVPNSPPYVRGVINLRGKVMPLVDLRLRLGMASSLADVEELVKLLQDREQDHRNWLAELEAAVKEDRSFRLTTDPHACAFGKWYDNYHTEDLKLGAILLAFDHPHKQIHAIGIESQRLMQQGKADEALKLIDRTRNGALARMIGLFDEARSLIRQQHTEIAMVLDHDGSNLAVTVDSVLAVETLEPESVQELPRISGATASGLVSWLGRRKESNDSVLVLDVAKLVGAEVRPE